VTGQQAVSRRSFLRSTALAGAWGAAAGAVLSGCTPAARRSAHRRSPDNDAAATGDVALMTRSLADEEQLLAYCSAAAARHPSLTRPLAPVIRVQRQHVTVMRKALDRAGGHGRLDPPVLPAGRAAVQAELDGLLRRAQRRRVADCVAARSGPLARFLASVAASHAVNLSQLVGSP
jgi:hypothetical protein